MNFFRTTVGQDRLKASPYDLLTCKACPFFFFITMLMLNLVVEAAAVGGFGQIYLVNTTKGKARKIIQQRNAMLDTGYIYSHPSFSPDGKSILWQHSGSDVSGGFTIMNLDGRISFQFPMDTEDPTPYWGPSLTRDGQKVLCFSPTVSDNVEDRIYLVDRKTGKATLITTGVKTYNKGNSLTMTSLL